MSDQHALLNAIAANPDEDTPRLAYADWLDEHATGAANHGRAEFIRAQCQIAQNVLSGDEDTEANAVLESRTKHLLDQFRSKWLAGFPESVANSAQYDRGFLSLLRLAAKDCVSEPPPPWFREPVVTLDLIGGATNIKRLLSNRWLDGVSSLDLQLTRPTGGDAVAVALAGSACASRLRRLWLWNDGFTDRGLRAIADVSFGALSEMSFMGRFSADAWAAVLASPAGARLVNLTVGHRGPWQTAARDRPGGALADVLARAPTLSGLQQLWLSGCGLGDAGCARVIGCGRFTALRQLRIGNDRAGVATGRALAAPPLPALTDLEITQCELLDACVLAFVKGPVMGQIRRLGLSLNQLTAASARAVARCRRARALESLDFGCNDIGDEGAIALARAKHFTALKEMHLSSTEITDAGADAVANAPWAGQLESLFMSYNAISHLKQVEMAARFGSVLWISGEVD